MARKKAHPYIPNSVREVQQKMMNEIGIESIEELYSDIPEKFRLKKKLNLPEVLSELELVKHIDKLLLRNKTCLDMPIFLGAGCWPHYAPAAVDYVIQRSELLTSYTPYQPEISQGILQALFEYQSMICELTEMEVANCSMYDWASALGEAARMAVRITRKNRILIPKIIHPERKATLQTYAEPAGIRIETIKYDKETGQLSLEDLKEKISEETAAVYIENPSYLGFIEAQVDEIAEITHKKNALFIVGVDPTSLGVLRPPGDYGADIVIGEGQPLGNPMNYGGPLLGIFACRDDMRLIRQMPGRIIGMTRTVDGSQRAFCMVLQTREQHIRREKATSNICSNEALCAVAAAVYMAMLGPEGFRELGKHIMYKANYAMKRLNEIEGIKCPVFDAVHFKEFTVNFDSSGKSVTEVHERLLEMGIHGGKDISKEFAELGQTALYCVTEIHSKSDIDRLVEALNQILEAK